MVRRPTIFALFSAAAVAAAVSFAPRSASAAILSSCGNIDLSSGVNCTFETSGGCTAQCTPVNVDVACSAQLEAMCSGGCNVSADASCTGSCNTSCMSQCSANPGSFNCQGSCEADCGATCQGSCSSNGNQSQCEASCKASCGDQCNVKCTATPPSADCSAQCTASCQGSCTAQVNMSCDVMCQSSLYANCETMVTGGCTAQCSQPQGALFCNGQYVNVDDSQLQDCLTQLKNELNINVNVVGDISCEGGECTATAAASASCGVSPETPPLSGGLLGLGLGAIGLAFVRRSRKA